MHDIMIDMGQEWACAAASWAEFEIMVMALQKTRGFQATVSFVDDALDWTADTPQLDLVSDGSQIAVRGHRPDARMYEFFGRQVEEPLTLVAHRPNQPPPQER